MQIFTIHNLDFGAAQIGEAAYYSQRFTTVSPSYAWEVRLVGRVGWSVGWSVLCRAVPCRASRRDGRCSALPVAPVAVRECPQTRLGPPF